MRAWFVLLLAAANAQADEAVARAARAMVPR
jgi:hypothetical protein